MIIIEVNDRNELLISKLFNIWENSVRATHLFLSDNEINMIAKIIPSVLKEISHLIVAISEKDEPVAFMGIAERNLEMLFISSEERGKGLGSQLMQYGIENYAINELSVNEQNPQAKGFYEHMGFEVYKRTDRDEQGNPYPILYMRLKTDEIKTDEVNALLSTIEDKDTSSAFKALQKLEQISEESDVLYSHIEKFISMIGSEKYVIRVRGFRLFCKQAKWDSQNLIDENILTALTILNDKKPTAVRQALSALQDVVIYKQELNPIIKEKVLAINYLIYKDTMHSLLAKDIQNLINVMEKEQNQ